MLLPLSFSPTVVENWAEICLFWLIVYSACLILCFVGLRLYQVIQLQTSLFENEVRTLLRILFTTIYFIRN